jgi:hypothetical protein
LPQPIPGCDDLKLRLFGDYLASTVERNALVDDDADIDGAGAAFVERLEPRARSARLTIARRHRPANQFGEGTPQQTARQWSRR